MARSMMMCLAFVAAATAASAALADAGGCDAFRTAISDGQDALIEMRFQFRKIDFPTYNEIDYYNAKVKQVQDSIRQNQAGLQQCLQNERARKGVELYEKNVESILDQAGGRQEQIAIHKDAETGIADAQSSVAETRSRLYEMQADFQRRTQFDAIQARERYEAMTPPPSVRGPSASDEAAIAALQEKAEAQLGSVEGALRNAERPGRRPGRRTAGGASRAPEDSAPSAGSRRTATSRCPDDMEYLRGQIASPELRDAPLVTVTAAVEGAGSLEQAISLTQAQIRAYEQELDTHRSNAQFRDQFPQQSIQYEQLLRDGVLVNQAYLEAMQCRLSDEP